MREEEGTRGEDEVRVAEEEECAGKGRRNGSKEQTYLHQWWPVAYILYISVNTDTAHTCTCDSQAMPRWSLQSKS